MSKFNDVEWWKEHIKEGDWLKLTQRGGVVMGEYVKIGEGDTTILITIYVHGLQEQLNYPLCELIDVEFRRGTDSIIADSVRTIYTNLERLIE